MVGDTPMSNYLKPIKIRQSANISISIDSKFEFQIHGIRAIRYLGRNRIAYYEVIRNTKTGAREITIYVIPR